LSVGLSGGLLAAVVELLLTRRHLLGEMTIRGLIDNIGFLLISHFALAIVVCTAVCLMGVLVALFRRLSLRGFQPGPWSFGGFVVGEMTVLAWWLAYVRHLILPAGLVGAVGILLGGLVILVPIHWLASRLRPTVVGRVAAGFSRTVAGPAAALLAVSVAVQWFSRHDVHPEGSFRLPLASDKGRATGGGPPNVVLVVFDALRVDRLGCYGYERPTSPHLDAFAADAVVFTRVISPGAWTVPSHASLFTGLYPSQHGARFGLGRLWLDEGFVTLAELLRNRGYQTMALSNNPIVSPITNLTQGFERCAVPRDLHVSAGAIMLPFYVRFLGRFEPLGNLFGRWFIEDPGGRATTQMVRRWLADRDRSRPFFLFINYMETHDPYQPPAAYRRRFVRPEDTSRSYWSGLNDDTIRWPYALAGKPLYTPRDIRILSDLYDARVREADDRFADLMHVLAAEVNLDETILVVVSDHGENLGDHGLIGHQFSIHNTLIHVPLIVRWPGVLKPRRVDDLVQSFDIFPTILSWTGTEIRQSAKVMARILPTATQPTTRPPTQESARQAFAEYLSWPDSELQMVRRLDPSFDPSRWQVALRAIFDGPYKQIERTGPSGTSFELFDLSEDPGEKHNLAHVDPATRDRLARQLAVWHHSFRPFDPKQFTGPRDSRLEDEQRRRLRDLGYVQ